LFVLKRVEELWALDVSVAESVGWGVGRSGTYGVVDDLLGLGRRDALPVDLVALRLVVEVTAEEKEEEGKQERVIVHPDQVVILDIAGGEGFFFPSEPAG
jgi:hypothetical protein